MTEYKSVFRGQPDLQRFYAECLIPAAQALLLMRCVMYKNETWNSKRFRTPRNLFAQALDMLHIVNLSMASRMARGEFESAIKRIPRLRGPVLDLCNAVCNSLPLLNLRDSSTISHVRLKFLDSQKLEYLSAFLQRPHESNLKTAIGRLSEAVEYYPRYRQGFIRRNSGACPPLVVGEGISRSISAWLTLARNGPWDQIVQRVGWPPAMAESFRAYFSSHYGLAAYAIHMAEATSSAPKRAAVSAPVPARVDEQSPVPTARVPGAAGHVLAPEVATVAQTPSVVVVIMDTGHFQWVATGATVRHAELQLVAAWRKHFKGSPRHLQASMLNLSADDDVAIKQLLAEYGTNTLEGVVGSAWRDDTEMTR